MDYKFLTGRENSFLEEIELNGNNHLIHKNVKEPFLKLKNILSQFNINLSLVSSFRSFDHQLKIWNAKASGKRKLFDKDENELNFKDLAPLEIMHSILRWSALPGASRHHWGCEIDIYDQNVKDKAQVNLTLKECHDDFQLLYSHINSYLEEYGFYRPYDIDRNGVSPELWHLSFKEISKECLDNFSIDLIKKSILATDEMLLKDEVLNHLEEIYQTYIINVSK